MLGNPKKINLKDCAYMVAEAKAVTLTHVWNKLKGISTEDEKERTGEDEDDVSLEGFRNIFLKIP